MTPFVEVRGLVKSYAVAGGRLPVLRRVDLTVVQGEMLAIVGASGVGKSTFLHVIGGLDTLDEGTVVIGGQRIDLMNDDARVAFRNRHVGFVFQFHHLLPEFTAVENVAMPLLITGQDMTRARARAAEVLDRVGLSDRLEHRPGALSGGEQQRVAVARALVSRPSLLLADEPTGNLDERTAVELHDLLRSTHREHGLTSIIVTHNSALAAACDRVVRLEDGQIHEGQRAEGRGQG